MTGINTTGRETIRYCGAPDANTDAGRQFYFKEAGEGKGEGNHLHLTKLLDLTTNLQETTGDK